MSVGRKTSGPPAAVIRMAVGMEELLGSSHSRRKADSDMRGNSVFLRNGCANMRRWPGRTCTTSWLWRALGRSRQRRVSYTPTLREPEKSLLRISPTAILVLA
jgi:hypothetical protein